MAALLISNHKSNENMNLKKLSRFKKARRTPKAFEAPGNGCYLCSGCHYT